MDLRYTPEETAFRSEVRAFFRASLPADIRRKQELGQRLSKQDIVTWQRATHRVRFGVEWEYNRGGILGWANEPAMSGVVHVLDPYHGMARGWDSADESLAMLEEIIQLEGAQTIAAFFLETVSGTNGILVRVIEYRLHAVPGAEPIYRLVTNILDPKRAPAQELAALYHERWEIETALDELKTHLRGAKIVLRSKTPDLVRQEFYGFMLAHFAIRGLMHEAALTAKEDPDRLSFLHTVRVVRRKLTTFHAIPPSAPEKVS